MRKTLAGYRSISDLVRVVEPWGEARKSRDGSSELHIQVELLSQAVRLDRSEHMEGSTRWGIIHYAGKLLCKENSQQATYQPFEFYQRLFVEAPVSCFSVSVDADIQAANDQASRLLDYRRDEFLGRNVLDLYTNDARGKPKARELFLRFRPGLEINRRDVSS
jgi:PAS domain-containing protein